MGEKIVIGIDAGGTHTRLMVADLKGHILAYRDTASARMMYNNALEENMKAAVIELLAQAGREPCDVAVLVAGMAGLNREEEKKMVEKLTDVPGLHCERIHVNDADIAHVGVNLGKPGIIASAGTGWTGMARIEDGRRVLTYTFPLLIGASALHLAGFVISNIIAGAQQTEDQDFVQEIFNYFGVKDTKELAENFITDNWYMTEMGMRVRGVAPITTAAAHHGIPLACKCCDQAIYNVTQAIKVLGGCFKTETVPYGLTGGLFQSEYIRKGIEKILSTPTNKKYELVQYPLAPVTGAVLMALEEVGVHSSDEIIAALRKHPNAIVYPLTEPS